MNIEFTKEELALIEEALVSWQNEPSLEGFFGSIAKATLGLAPRDKVEAANEVKRDTEKVRSEIKKREIQVMRMRLKIHEVLSRQAEFTSAS